MRWSFPCANREAAALLCDYEPPLSLRQQERGGLTRMRSCRLDPAEYRVVRQAPGDRVICGTGAAGQPLWCLLRR